VNRQISRLAVFALALIVALVVATTYWQTWASGGLADRQDNQIQRVAEFTIKRGLILDGSRVLARNREQKVSGRTLYLRRYPQGKLTAHVVGYSTQSRARAGLERSLNDYLTGSNSNLSTLFSTALDKLRGTTVTGNDVRLTLNLKAQKAALDALAGRCGAAVAIDVRTGKVLTMVSSPSYDPNLVEGKFGLIQKIPAPCHPSAALVNRATDGLYIPGSTFKVITTAAALDTGKFRVDSRFTDRGYCIEYGQQVRNFGDQNGPEVFGNVDFTQALEHSINAVFCEIGKTLGAATVLEYAKRFGFYAKPPLETPENERQASGLYKNGRLYDPADPAAHVDPGRLAFGQEKLLVTPLQMAMVAGTIANHGVVMRPWVVDRIVSPKGKTIQRTKPDALGRAVKPETADAVAKMMLAVVQGGTGTAAQIPGLVVGGKTGTAETGRDGINTAWFICYAGRDTPEVAVAVVLEDQRTTGGVVAAPVAKAIVQALLPPKSNS